MSKKGHLKFGLPGNVILEKKPWSVQFKEEE